MRRLYGLSAGCMVLLLTVLVLSPARAIELHMSLTYDGSYQNYDPYTDTLGAPTDYLLTDDATSIGTDDVHAFSVYYELTGTSASPDQSLSLVLFDVTHTGSLIPYWTYASDGVRQGYWLPTTGDLMYDPEGPLGSAPVFATNEDASLWRLERIIVITNGSPAYVHGADPGETGAAPPWGGPLKLGTFWLRWNGQSTVATVGLQRAASAWADPWCYYEGTTMVPQGPGNFLVGPPLRLLPEFGSSMVPEPASALLAGLAIVFLVAFVRRQ
jgi:hypothetical protein